LLTFARKGTKKMHAIDVCKVVDDVISFLENHSDFRDVKMTAPAPCSRALMVYGNEQEISQVIINLMINACHAVAKKGGIQVEIACSDDKWIHIAVKDNGTGIPKKDFSRIFDPFFTTKPVGEGTGLGLSVGYGIIRRHGGDIRVRNRKDKGAAFTITLPLLASSQNADPNREEMRQ
jgi:signal transduction histidine kinase